MAPEPFSEMEELTKIFLSQAEENLSQIEENAVLLESQPNDLEVINNIFRAVHKLKGDAMLGEFDAVAETAHSLEDLLENVRQKKIPVEEGLISLLLSYLDCLRAMVGRVAQQSRAPDAAAPTTNHAPTCRQRDRAVRVDTARLDRMMNLSGEIAIARERRRRLLEDARHALSTGFWTLLNQSEHLETELQDLILKSRLVPVGPLFRQNVRAVRDIGKALRKPVDLRLEGEWVEVDTLVIDRLHDPLLHMVRNAIDHGIESADERRLAGKPERGTLILKAFHEAGQIMIQVIDDGRGLDPDKILARARQRELISDNRALTHEQIFEFIFEPGFSTSDTVTEISGRGMGMDIVRRNVAALRGRIGVDSVRGRGTTLTLRLPLTMAIIQGLGVVVGPQDYIVPLESVLECLDSDDDAVKQTRSGGVVDYRGEPLPLLRLRDLFKIPGPAPQRENIVVVTLGGHRAGVVVDRLLGQHQIVIKPLDTLFESLAGLSGTAVMGDGRVALILDVATLLKSTAGERVEAMPVLAGPSRARPTERRGAPPRTAAAPDSKGEQP